MPLTAADRALLVRCLNHDQGAWREFVDRFLGLIYHVVQHSAELRNQTLRPEDTEDLAAEVLSQIVARNYAVLRQFRGQSSLTAYLTVVARRICLHEMARRASLREVHSRANHEPSARGQQPAPPPENAVENREEVERLLARLQGRDRQVVRMFYIEGKTYDEIADELQVPRNSIGPILTRARDQLREE